jgi:hypothetical protein
LGNFFSSQNSVILTVLNDYERPLRIDEASGDDQQVIQGQFQQTAQFDDDQLLRGGKRGMQGVRPMRTVFQVFVSSSRLCYLDVVALLML